MLKLVAFIIRTVDRQSFILACSVLDPDSDFKDAASLVLEELGENMHIALHSRASELQYQRQLVESLLPLLLPSSALGSRYVCGHIFEQNNIHDCRIICFC